MYVYIYMFAALLLILPACKNAPPQQEAPAKRIVLSSGDTLGESMKENGFDAVAGVEITKALSGVFNPRYCRPGDYYEVRLDTAGRWQSFDYYPYGLAYYTVERSSAGKPVALKKTRNGSIVVSTAKGAIQTSLWDAMVVQKIPPELINDFTDKFAWQIDFLTEPRIGDRYKLVWENFVTEDGLELKGKILAAQYTASGQVYTTVLYKDAAGQESYYAPDGKSLKRAFLKAPLQYARISSFFSRRRFHPVLRYFRPHLGIDYAAPSGTPVSSVADGTVTFAGRKGGFGNYLAIRHTNGYSSYYGHLKGFKKGVRRGARVGQ